MTKRAQSNVGAVVIQKNAEQLEPKSNVCWRSQHIRHVKMIRATRSEQQKTGEPQNKARWDCQIGIVTKRRFWSRDGVPCHPHLHSLQMGSCMPRICARGSFTRSVPPYARFVNERRWHPCLALRARMLDLAWLTGLVPELA